MAKLRQQYTLRLEKLQNQFAAEGNLEKAVIARTILRSGKYPTTAESTVDEITSAQRIFLQREETVSYTHLTLPTNREV